MQIDIFKKVYLGPLAVTVLFGLVLNILTLKSSIVGLILGVIWVAWLIWVAKGLFNSNGIWVKAIFAVVAYLIIVNSLAFYLFRLTTLAIIAILVISTLAGIYISKKPTQNKIIFFSGWRFSTRQIILLSTYLFFYILAFVLLFDNQSAEAIRTPWEVVPKIFFVVYFLLTGILMLVILAGKENEDNENFCKQKIVLISLHFLLSLIIATIIYKIGFGFDPFIHRAAESALRQLGYITPKPLYYIGQYSLVVWWSKISMISIDLTDKLLVPLLAALTLPITMYDALKSRVKEMKVLLLSVVFSLAIITPLFFYTVPQSLANLIFLSLIFFSLASIIHKEKIPIWQWIMLMAIFFIHPLTALPAFIWLAFWTVWRSRIKKVFQALWLIFSAMLIPLFFLLLGRLQREFALTIQLQNLSNFGKYLSDNIFNYLPFHSIYHLLYLYSLNGLLLFLGFLAVGIFYFKKQEKQITIGYLLLILIFLINLILVSLLDFQALIGYEQLEFAKRLLQIIALAVMPIFLMGVYSVLKSILKIRLGRWIAIFFGSLILTGALYLAYPHNDAFEKGRSYAVSRYDSAAVLAIEKDAKGNEYVVLANQSVSAASLKELGFKKYYIIPSVPLPTLPFGHSLDGLNSEGMTRKIQQLFYYPIPTSSPLYEIYLDMIYNGPTMKKIEKARALTGVEKIYFVVNNYWLDAKKRIAEAEKIADEDINIEGKVRIFGFLK